MLFLVDTRKISCVVLLPDSIASLRDSHAGFSQFLSLALPLALSLSLSLSLSLIPSPFSLFLPFSSVACCVFDLGRPQLVAPLWA